MREKRRSTGVVYLENGDRDSNETSADDDDGNINNSNDTHDGVRQNTVQQETVNNTKHNENLENGSIPFVIAFITICITQ